MLVAVHPLSFISSLLRDCLDWETESHLENILDFRAVQAESVMTDLEEWWWQELGSVSMWSLEPVPNSHVLCQHELYPPILQSENIKYLGVYCKLFKTTLKFHGCGSRLKSRMASDKFETNPLENLAILSNFYWFFLLFPFTLFHTLA